nr:HD domain-containing phosphohydrolase [Syntrophomonas palmitatica]
METFNHCIRVANIAKWVGRCIQLTEYEINDLYDSAILHDVGKIKIPIKILNKPGPLNSNQMKLIKMHPAWGSELIAEKQIKNGILSHHEKYDGSGYPYGIKGKEIPLNGRIIAIVDSLDAMLIKRPYRKNLSLQEAFKEIEQYSGVYYDPDIVTPILLRKKDFKHNFYTISYKELSDKILLNSISV